jgi:hypothetical protein
VKNGSLEKKRWKGIEKIISWNSSSEGLMY